MGRRIEVELTSARADGTWTWRAAGAKQPKGVVDAALLYEGAQVGDVVRAEADFEIEGITITAVLPPKDKKRSEPERLEIIGPPREHQGVTSSLVAKSDRPRPERGPGRDRDGRDGRPRRDGMAGDARRSGPPRPREGATAGGGRPRTEGRPRPDGRPHGERARTEGARPERPARHEGARAQGRERRPPTPPPEPPPPKPKRLAPANVHRTAVVESLPPEQRPVAEQVLRGGIPAVRQAIEAQNARLREEGQSEVKAGPLVALAEQLLPQLKAAEWRDRAEAAVKVVDDVSLRDLRSVVAGADAARDDEGRLLAGTLRQALERRVNEQRERWVTDIAGALDEGRLVRALRLSAHPPDPSTRFPAELAVRLSEAAGAAMTPEATPDRWATLLDAVSESPVRRSVKPAGLPAEPGEALLHAARQASGRVPAVAALLGITMPPPPGPPRSARPATRGRPPGPAGARRRPPPPPRPPAPAGDEQTAPATSAGDATTAAVPSASAAPLTPAGEPSADAAPPARAGEPDAAPPATAGEPSADAAPQRAPESTSSAPDELASHEAAVPAPAAADVRPEAESSPVLEPPAAAVPEPAVEAPPASAEPTGDVRPEPDAASPREPAADVRPEPADPVPDAVAEVRPEAAADTRPEPALAPLPAPDAASAPPVAPGAPSPVSAAPDAEPARTD